MAYVYRGLLSKPSDSNASWNGSQWNPPQIILGSAAAIGMRQGIDPPAFGSWDRKTFRVNPVKILRETGFCIPIVVDKWKPASNAGYDVTANIPLVPSTLRTIQASTLAWPEPRAQYVLQKTLAKLHASDFDLGTNLGELRETLDMLRNPLKGIRDFLRRSSRQKSESVRRYSKRLTDASSSTWLEYRYGIRPLISAVSDAIELYEKGFKEKLLDKMYRKKSRILLPSAGSVTYDSVDFNAFRGRRMISVSTESFMVGKCYYKYTQLPTVYERLGIDMSALPGIAWELTRMSFVWDWFFGVGNWIESLRAEIDRDILGISVSHKVVQKIETTILPGSVYVLSKPVWKPPVDTTNKFVFQTELLERRLYSTSGITLPAFNPSSLGLLKQIDSLSLIWQRMPRR